MKTLHGDGLAGVIFDLDGTMSDTWAISLSSFRTALAELAPRIFTDQELMGMAGPAEEGIFQRLLPDHWEECFERYIEVYTARVLECDVLFAGIYDVLALLRSRQVKLAVVSGKSRRAVEVTLKQAGITGHFDAVTAGSANGDLKRHNIQVIINAWGFDPRTIAFVGDTDADIDAANAAGVIAVGAAWSDNAKAGALEITGADVVFSEVATFHSWLKLGTHRHLGKA